MRKKKLALPLSLFWIIGSTLIVTGSVYSLGKSYFAKRQRAFEGPSNEIIAILQTGPEKEALSTTYLAQLMDLSLDYPTPTYAFDPVIAKQKLKESLLIKEAEIDVIKPGTVFVDYTIRKPVAKLYDFENTAFDEEGHTFPLFPFISPRYLPEVYLGIKAMEQPLCGKAFTLASKVLSTIREEESFSELFLHRIDVSNAFLESYGKRELILIFKSIRFSKKSRFIFTYFLRLSPQHYLRQLENFISLRRAYGNQKEDLFTSTSQSKQPDIEVAPTIIDLRLDELAFIQEAN